VTEHGVRDASGKRWLYEIDDGPRAARAGDPVFCSFGVGNDDANAGRKSAASGRHPPNDGHDAIASFSRETNGFATEESGGAEDDEIRL
jgi:hypothetical protein